MEEPRRKERPCAHWCPYSDEPLVLLRVEDHGERWEAMRREAQEDARRIARRIVDEFDAERVWLYGSAAGWPIFHDWSDIDMAVVGPRDYMDITSPMYLELTRMTRFPLDIHNYNDFRPDFWVDIVPQPVLLAERAKP